MDSVCSHTYKFWVKVCHILHWLGFLSVSFVLGKFQQGARFGRVNQSSPRYHAPQQLPPSYFPHTSRWQSRTARAPNTASVQNTAKDSGMFICKYCSKSFISAQKLKAHERFHESLGRYPCRFCSRGFATCEDLKRHERVHTGEKPYKCSYCPRAFAILSTLKSHETIHTGVKPFRCQTCGKGFTKKNVKRQHEKQYGHWWYTVGLLYQVLGLLTVVDLLKLWTCRWGASFCGVYCAQLCSLVQYNGMFFIGGHIYWNVG